MIVVDTLVWSVGRLECGECGVCGLWSLDQGHLLARFRAHFMMMWSLAAQNKK